MGKDESIFIDAVIAQQVFKNPYEEYSRYHWLLSGDLDIRQNFADKLNICSTTLQRWEDNILNYPTIISDYFGDRARKQKLDKYQRFLLVWIYVNKLNPKTKKQEKTYSALQLRLRLLIASGKISRDDFYKYLEVKNGKKTGCD